MADRSGPHRRNQRPGVIYRGSKKRVARLSVFEKAPVDFWLFIAIGVAMLGICAALMFGSTQTNP